MRESDRLDNPRCAFSAAMAFGTRDRFASSQGGEDILRILGRHNSGRVNLFRVGGDSKATGGTHVFPMEFPEETARMMLGHFDGSIQGRWEPTVLGAHIPSSRRTLAR